MSAGLRLSLLATIVSLLLAGCGGDDDDTTTDIFGGGSASGVTGATGATGFTGSTGATGESGSDSGTIAIAGSSSTAQTLGEVISEEEESRRGREEKVLADAADLGPLLNEFWERELSNRYRIVFDAPDRYEYYYGEEPTACGGQVKSRAENAFYCEADGEEQVAFDLNWFQQYLEESPGGATTFLILAHEWGHAVQDSWLENGGEDVWNPASRKELNADCLAGVFLAASIRGGSIVEEAGDAEAMFGWLYTAGNAPWFGVGSHGTRGERQAAFRAGTEADTEYCRNTY